MEMRSKIWCKTILVAGLVVAVGLLLSALASPMILGPNEINKEEWNLLNEINNHRASNGLSAVVLSRKFSNCAAQWSRHMASVDVLHHPYQPPTNDPNWWQNCVTQQGYPWQYPYVADICAGGVAFSGETAIEAINTWKGSSLHNDVILERGSWSMANWTAVGIGQAYNSSTNKWFWTAVFGEHQLAGDSIGAPDDGIDPSVSITNPADGSTVSGTVTVTASASDATGIAFVEFYLNPQPSPPWTTLQSTDYTSPYTHIWDTTIYPYASATWGAKAYDQKGNTEHTTITVNVSQIVNRPPNTPSITGPTSGLVGVSYSYTLTTADPDGDPVQFTVDWGDGNIITTPLCPNPQAGCVANHIWATVGTFNVKAKATDSKGAESGWSAPLQITITASDGDVKFQGTVTQDESQPGFPVCYGNYVVPVRVDQILSDPVNLLQGVSSVEVCYGSPLGLRQGERVEVYGHYWKHAGPMQLVGRVQASGDSYYIKRLLAPLPDLIVKSMSWRPATPSVGDVYVYFDVVIRNQGLASANLAGMQLSLYKIKGAQKILVAGVTWTTGLLAAGTSMTQSNITTMQYSQLTWEGGTFTIRACIDDPSNVVTESDETNNCLERQITILGRAVTLHIVAGRITPPPGPIPGVPITYSVQDPSGNPIPTESGTKPTPFTLSYPQGFKVILNAPPTYAPYSFKQWMVDGATPRYYPNPLTVVLDPLISGAEAQYEVAAPSEPGKLCQEQGKTISATEVCNNNIGYSNPGPAGGDPRCRTVDCCNWYQKSHVHDLGRIVSQSDLIVEYTPGFSNGCTSTVTIEVSPDNINWRVVQTFPTTTVDLNPPYQNWKKYIIKIHNVINYRYVRVTIPNCYNDFSAVYVCGEEVAPSEKVTLTVRALAENRIGPITLWIEVNVSITTPWGAKVTPFSQDVKQGQTVLLIAPLQIMTFFGSRNFSEWKCDGDIYPSNSLLITINQDMTCTAIYVIPEE